VAVYPNRIDVFGENIAENWPFIEGDPKTKEVMNDARKAWLECPAGMGSRSITADIGCGFLRFIGRGP